jgi:hypothetical protein
VSIWIYLALGVAALILFNVLLLAALSVLNRERDDQDDDAQ